MGLASTSGTALDSVTFRRTETDRKPPSRVVTAKLLGDPAPDRFEQAEAIRRRVMAKVITLAPVSVRDLLEAISHQPMGANDAGRALGCSPSAASDRAKRAKAMGYLEMSQHRSRTGRLTTYKITASGRAYLAEDGQ
jgi:DNA-binding MarR family transcriptional regulator